MCLQIAKPFLRGDIATSRDHFEIPGPDFPRRWIGTNFVGGGAQAGGCPLGKIFAIEQDDGVRRRLSRLYARRYDLRVRPRRIVHMPRKARQQWRVCETLIGLLSDSYSRGQRESDRYSIKPSHSGWRISPPARHPPRRFPPPSRTESQAPGPQPSRGQEDY